LKSTNKIEATSKSSDSDIKSNNHNITDSTKVEHLNCVVCKEQREKLAKTLPPSSSSQEGESLNQVDDVKTSNARQKLDRLTNNKPLFPWQRKINS
jgi:hypothetical protein